MDNQIVKKRFQLWTTPDVLETIETMYKVDDCKSRSEFIEKAISYYVGYLTAGDKTNYLPNIFLSSMKSINAETENRVSRILFKVAVELAMMQNIVAATNNLDPISLSRVRGECVKEVKKTGGIITLDKAADWQKGD